MDGQEKVGGRAEGAPRMEQIKDAPWIREAERTNYSPPRYEDVFPDLYDEFDELDGCGACPVLSIGGD